MEKEDILSFTDVKKRVGEHLKTALNITEFSITFAKHEGKVWKVNVEFKEKVGNIYMPTSALLNIDGTTGEIKTFQKGRYWRY